MNRLQTVILTCLLVLAQPLWAIESPIPMLETTASQILATLKQNGKQLKQNQQVIHRAVNRYLLPHVDVKGMSRSVLGRQAWNAATPDEQEQFTRSFTQLVIRTYSSPLAEYSGETIKFLPLHSPATKEFTRVNSLIIRPNGQTIPLSYSLVAKNGQWKIYDLSVEGVSLLQSFHSQFSQILQNSSMHELIVQMDKNTIKAS